MRHLLALFLLATPALTQDPMEALEQRLAACLGDMDMDAIGARAEAFAIEHDFDDRIAGLCAAGDAAGATALARELEAEFYASDAEAARMRACLVAELGEKAIAGGDPCVE